MKLYAYNEASAGARALATELGIMRLRHEGSRFRGAPNKVVINYGSSRLPEEVMRCRVINTPDRVSLCSNKLNFFRHTSQAQNAPRLPEWTVDRAVALGWVNDGHLVCARQVLNGHSAAGLIIMDRNDPSSLVDAPLYVKYVKKKDEYRVHVVNGAVIDTQRKGVSQEFKDALPEGEKVNTKVRNLANGYIFVRNDGRPVPADVHTQALAAITAVGLDFGAVDIVYNESQSQAYVLEINTAPGLMGTTVTNYANALRAYA